MYIWIIYIWLFLLYEVDLKLVKKNINSKMRKEDKWKIPVANKFEKSTKYMLN